MSSKKILILGGYGNAGLPICELLLKHTDSTLLLAGRNMEKASEACKKLNNSFEGDRAFSKFVDAGVMESLKNSMHGVDLVLVASSTSKYTREVAGTAIALGIDYFDIQFSTEKIRVLKSLEDKILQAGFCFITDAGFHPGLPAALVRYAAKYFDTYQIADVGSLIRFNWDPISVCEETKIEFVHELTDYQGLIFKNGRWKTASMWSTHDFIKMDMGEPFGKKLCTPLFLEEMRNLPELFPALKQTGFYIAGFNWFTDLIIMPLIMLALKILPHSSVKAMARLMFWSMKRFSSPPYKTILKLDASGLKNGIFKSVSVELSHDDGYKFTAIPAVACLLQYLDGTIHKPGLWFMANAVNPERLIKDIGNMGIEIKISQS